MSDGDGTVQRLPSGTPLKFGDRPLTTATLAFKNGEDAATVRLDDGKDISEGGVLDLRNRLDESFGRADVVEVIPCDVHYAIHQIQKRGARYPISGVEYLISALAGYYEQPIRRSTKVKVIIYRPTALGFGDGPLIRRESPKGDTPADDVACADCGAYRPLIGPLNFSGDVYVPGDMVCSDCAESRGFDLDITIQESRMSEEIRERLTGERMVHRLRDWKDGDALHGVVTINRETGTEMGKTFREGGPGDKEAWKRARAEYERPALASVGVTALYTATVRDPRTDPVDPTDPGEPPGKRATLTDVTVMDWKQNGDGGGEDGLD